MCGKDAHTMRRGGLGMEQVEMRVRIEHKLG